VAELVPGIGTMTGERRSSQAMATWWLTERSLPLNSRPPVPFVVVAG
jgi:hypothetical protein